MTLLTTAPRNDERGKIFWLFLLFVFFPFIFLGMCFRIPVKLLVNSFNGPASEGFFCLFMFFWLQLSSKFSHPPNTWGNDQNDRPSIEIDW